MATGKLKIGLDLSGRNLYVNVTSALTPLSSLATVIVSSGGYQFVEQSSGFTLINSSGTIIATYYRSTYSLPYTTTIVLPDDFGYLTEVNIESASYGVLTRDAHIRVHAYSEDGEKVNINREWHVGNSTGGHNFRNVGYITSGNTAVYITIPLIVPVGTDVNNVVLDNLVTGSTGTSLRLRQEGEYVLGSGSTFVNLYDYITAGKVSYSASITPFCINMVFNFTEVVSGTYNNENIVAEFRNFSIGFE